MAKRIMLPFQLRIYPLAILFEDAILLGAESDATMYAVEPSSPFSLPFCVVERTSQVYLHQILRQLLRRNLGFHAWEIARSCTALPYFPHSLELLLHEVLEEEATSKDPLPDALLPGVVEFIGEFPRERPRCIVQCARKTEVALWPCLFAAVGRPRILFERCLAAGQLRTAASYLIILQNLECSSVSRQHATQLLDAALEQGRWELSRDLVRFLRAIDPSDIESPRASFSLLPSKFGSSHPQTPAVCPNEEDLSLLLGTMQVSRGRSFSTTSTTKSPGWGAGSIESKTHQGSVVSEQSPIVPIPQVASASAAKGGHREIIRSNSESRSVGGGSGSGLAERIRKKSEPGGFCVERKDEEPYLDLVLQRHARKLLKAGRLGDLGRLSAWHAPYFGLVSWLRSEQEGAARLPHPPEVALRSLHANLRWPFPNPPRTPTSVSGQNFPTIGAKITGDSRSSSSGIHSLPTPTDEACGMGIVEVECSFGGSKMAVRGSQGRKHCQSLPLAASSEASYIPPRHAQVLEAQLMPHLVSSQGEDRSYRSEESSWWGDDGGEEGERWGNSREMVVGEEEDGVEDEMGRVMFGSEQQPIKDALGDTKMVPQGTDGHLSTGRAEVQLRYLHQLFVEARCLEWALVVAVALRDVGALAHTVRAALRPRSPSCPSPAVEAARLRDILSSLYQWSASQCLVYKPFLTLVYGHISVLSKHAAGVNGSVEETKDGRMVPLVSMSIQTHSNVSNVSPNLATNSRGLECRMDVLVDRLDSCIGDDVVKCVGVNEKGGEEVEGAVGEGRQEEEASLRHHRHQRIHHPEGASLGDGSGRRRLEQCDEEGESYSDDGLDNDTDYAQEENGSRGSVCVLS